MDIEKDRVIEIDLDLTETSLSKNETTNTGKTFWTTDLKTSYLYFKSTYDITNSTASLVLKNTTDGSVIQKNIDVEFSQFFYMLSEKEVERAGNWIGQIVVEKDGKALTSRSFKFHIKGSLLDTAEPSLSDIDNYQKFYKQLNDLETEMSEFLEESRTTFGTISANENERKTNELSRIAAENVREENYESKLTAAIVEADVVEKVDNKVAELAPTIQQVTAQLAHKAEQTQSNSLQSQINAISLQGTSGDSSAEVASARVDTVGSIFPTVKGHLDNIEIIFKTGKAKLSFNDWVQGAVSNTNGLDGASTTRIRTSGFHTMPVDKIITVKIASGYRIITNYYNESKVFQSAYGWSTSDFVLNPNYPYYRFMVAKVVDETAVVDWANNITFEYVENVFVGDKSITEDKLMDNSVTPRTASFIDTKYSANSFDKTKYTSGYYLAYGSGNKTANTSFGYSEKIKTKPLTTYYLFSSSDYQIVYYDENGLYLSGEILSSTLYSFTTPENCESYVISFNLEKLNSLMITESTSRPTAYVAYSESYEIPSSYLPSKKGKTLFVSQQVPFRYLTIASACAEAEEGDSIYVYSGTYVESIDIRDKTLYIIGECKDTCFLISTSNSYDYPPIEGARGGIYNMTVWAKREEGVEKPADGRMPYGLHLDYSYSKDGSYVVDNCDVKSDWNAAIGVGFKSGFKLHLKKSTISSTADTVNGAFFFHDADVESQMGIAELVVDNCNFRAPNIVLMPTSYGNVLNTLKMTWYRNVIYSDVNGKTNGAVGVGRAVTGSGWRTYNNFFLTPDSFGNNIPLFNVV